jgi:nitrate/TMAO reductase-like tetraheme cytochrome c subunit
MPLSSAVFAEDAPKVRDIPGITTEDTRPKGCVDCHKKEEKDGKVVSDTRLSLAMDKWINGDVEKKLQIQAQAILADGLTLKAKHPASTSSLQNIPAKCISCHTTMYKKGAPPFGQLIHLIHLTDKEKNKYLVQYGGECTNCHKPDLAKGTWSHPSAPEYGLAP